VETKGKGKVVTPWAHTGTRTCSPSHS
jgi:hypothetical protein